MNRIDRMTAVASRRSSIDTRRSAIELSLCSLNKQPPQTNNLFYHGGHGGHGEDDNKDERTAPTNALGV